jgi:hypothetical protein
MESNKYSELMKQAAQDPQGYAKAVAEGTWAKRDEDPGQEVVRTQFDRLSKSDAEQKLNAILADQKHPYWTFTPAEKHLHDAAVSEVLSLYRRINGVPEIKPRKPARSKNPEQYEMSPEEASNQLALLQSDKAYLFGELPPMEQSRRQALAQRLMEIASSKDGGSIEGWLEEHNAKIAVHESAQGELLDPSKEYSSGNGDRTWVTDEGAQGMDRSKAWTVEDGQD